jgi:hypothetical protein
MLLVLLLAPAAAAQGESDRFDCRLMGGLQCRPESRAELLAHYGLPSAESRLAAGSQMYRVFIFDAWMKHWGVITVERSPGSAPTLTLHAAPRPNRQGSGSQQFPPQTVPITIANWSDVQRRGANFDRLMVALKLAPLGPGDIRVCGGHGPLYFVESGDPEAGEEGGVRRSGLSDSCWGGGLAEPFAIEVALLAAEVLPACAALDESLFHWTAQLLRACSIFSGDGLAAAEVYNLMRPLLAEERDRPSADRLEQLFREAEFGGTGAGEGAGPAAQAWLQALAGEGRSYFLVERVHAENANHVLVEGILRRRIRSQSDRDGDRTEEAPVQLEWGNGLAGFEVKRVTIGAYEQGPDLCNARDHRRRAVDC